MPYSKSTQKDYGDNPLQKRSGFKMKGYSYPGESPMKKDTGEVVSKTSPGPGWTKTKGTNIWAPPKGEMMAKVTKLKRKVGTNFATVRSDIKMKPPYKKPVGPIVD